MRASIRTTVPKTRIASFVKTAKLFSDEYRLQRASDSSLELIDKDNRVIISFEPSKMSSKVRKATRFDSVEVYVMNLKQMPNDYAIEIRMECE